MQWQNSINDICANQTQFCHYLQQYFEIQLDWMYEQIESYPDNEYWHQVCEEKKRKSIYEYF